MNSNTLVLRHVIIKPEKVRIINAAREKQSISYKGTPTGYQLTSLKKHHRPEGSGKIYSKSSKGKTVA